MLRKKFSAIGFATLMCLTLVFLGCPPPPVTNRVPFNVYLDDSDSLLSEEEKKVDDSMQEEMGHNAKIISKVLVVKFGTRTNPVQVSPESFVFPPLPDCKSKPDPRDVVSNANERIKKDCEPKEKEFANNVQGVLAKLKIFISQEEPEPSCTDFKELRARLKIDEPAYGLVKTDGFTECRDKKVEKFEQKGKLVIIQVPSKNPQDFEQNTKFLEAIFPKAMIIKSTESDSIKRAFEFLFEDAKRENK